MSSTTAQMQAYLDELGVTCPAERCITAVSNLYHEAESRVYDDMHLELDDSAVAWTHRLETIAPVLPTTVRVLDVGAGRWRRLRRLTSPAADRGFRASSPAEPSIVEETNAAVLARAAIQRPLAVGRDLAADRHPRAVAGQSVTQLGAT